MGRQGGISINELSPQLQLLLMNVKSGNNGIGFMKSTVNVTTTTQEVSIGKAFNIATDCLFAIKNTTYIEEGIDYTITTDGKIKAITDTWIGTVAKPIVFNFIILKAIPINDVVLDGDMILDGSIDITKLDKSIQDLLNSLSVDLKAKVDSLDKLTASLKTRVDNLEKLPRIWALCADPGTNSKAGDIWIDPVENIIKERLATGTWKDIGATYN